MEVRPASISKCCPTLMGWVAFLSYLLEIDTDNRIAIWGLVAVVLFGYLISIFIWFRSRTIYNEDEIKDLELTKRQQDRLEKHAKHLRAIELFKIK